MRPSTQGAKVAGDWTDSRLEIDPTPSQVREDDPLCASSFHSCSAYNNSPVRSLFIPLRSREMMFQRMSPLGS